MRIATGKIHEFQRKNFQRFSKMKEIDEATLLRLAEAEILGEAKKATVRHAIAGPSGWKPVPKTNKSFLVNTLLQTLSSNRILSKKHGGVKDLKKSERKFLQIDRKQGTSHNIVFKKSKISETIQKRSKHNNEKSEKKRTKKCKSKRKGKIKK